MKRAACLMVIIAFALAVSSANVCRVKQSTGASIMTLDICSHHAPAASADITTIAEPSYEIPQILITEEIPFEESRTYEFTIISPIDRPPTA